MSEAKLSKESRTVSGRWVALAWAATILFSWWGIGSYLGILAEGNDRSLIPRGPLVPPALAVVVSLVLTVIWARGLGRDAAAPAHGLGRRRFLVGSATTLGGLALTLVAPIARNWRWKTIALDEIFLNQTPRMAENPKREWAGARVQAYRRLGRTGVEVSDVSFGSGRIKPGKGGEAIASEAIDRGVNYFDTAPDYSATGSETALGRAMKGRRDQMFLATKFCNPEGNLPAGSSVSQYMNVVEGSLKRLQTDYVDLVHIHSCDSLERLLDPNVHEAFDRLKQQGKVRFLGFSSHTPNLEQVANTAIDDGRFDVMMLAYHHGAWPNLASIIDRAHAADIGVVAMKTLKGAKHQGLLEYRDEADSYTQAAFKWVLQNPSVSCLGVAFYAPPQIDEYLYASGEAPAPGDTALLDKYDRLIAGKHCFQHCGACLDSCPENLPIDDVLRYRMYFEDYGDEKEALRLYSKLEIKADVCAGCSAPCAHACPFGIPIPERTAETHQMLTLDRG